MNSSKPKLISEVLLYLKKSRNYWLVPMILVFVLFAALIIVAETVPVVSPFVYTLF